jgi:dipeptidyl aminopeptidase/acylaminoacyl peptidase
LLTVTAQAQRAVAPEDMFAIKDVGDVRLSPDGARIAYTVTQVDRQKNRYLSHVWIVSASDSTSTQITTGEANDSSPRWSPDGLRIAFVSARDGAPAIWTVHVQTRELKKVTGLRRSNFFLSKAGEMFCWSPDGKHIAFVAADASFETAPADPRVISRAQYKTRTSFSDNLNSHIFIVPSEGGQARQLTRGPYDNHSIAWSPLGNEIAFLSNREKDPDLNFNYDIFAIDVKTGREQRLTSTPGVEFSPIWSPDGLRIAYTATKRKMTTIDSVAEDAHVWVIERAGLETTEASAALDRRASSPQWAADGKSIYFLAGDQGKTLVFNVPAAGGQVTRIFDGQFQMGALSVAKEMMAFTRSDPARPQEVWAASISTGPMRRLTEFNKELEDDWKIVRPENLRFPSFDGTEIEGWLIKPLDFREGKKYPLILTIHGGPHGMYGYGFNHANQVYAARNYGVLYLNPRGSSGYGQKFADGCINNWGGGDYQDLMKGVDYAVGKHRWIDTNRLGVMGGSYGGFMTNWVITQTPRFKAAVAVASLSNLISFYGTSLYQDLIHVEFNGFPWDNYDLLWKYSPVKYVKSVVTPTLFIHGELDNDVHITQAEEMFIGLKRRGIETIFVRYPREGHGIREPAHRLDYLNRALGWFDRFIRPNVE